MDYVLVLNGKIELESSELEYLAEKMIRQWVKGATWYLLTAYSKTLEERDKLGNKLANRS